MDLRQLRYFVAVVEEQGFRKASRALYVAQPAISHALRQLEEELGITLLNRTSRGVELTDAGREFLGHAYGMLHQAEEAKAAMRARASWRPGSLRIGAIAGILGAGELTAPIFQEHRRAHPELNTAFEELSFCDQVGPILTGGVDAAIVRGPLDHPELEVIPIATERRALLVGAHHELADEVEVDVQDVLDQHTLPLGAPGSWSGFWQLDDLRGRTNPHPDVAPTRTIRDMQRVVAEGQTVITVPDAMSRLAPSSLVCSVGLRGAAPSTIGIARRRGDKRREVTSFIDEAAHTAERFMSVLPGGALPV